MHPLQRCVGISMLFWIWVRQLGGKLFLYVIHGLTW